MQFVDLAKIHARSGSGGAGAVSFRREKFVEFGGPDGGNGGRGGGVFVEADPNLNTLVDFRYQRHVIAGDGKAGRGKMRTGANGKDTTFKVPVGTEILDEHREGIIHDLVKSGERRLLLPGGNGGFGNSHFKSSTNQTPRTANKGQPGLERTYWLRLKVLADAGLLGLPNAGKSTFLSVVSNARPKISGHPFTTLHPILGVIGIDGVEFVMADIPGLIEGAHEGRGIGDLFLGHVERCRVLVHLVDGTSSNVSGDYRVVINELREYGKGLADKPRISVLTKIDALSDQELADRTADLEEASGGGVMAVSAISGTGIESCLRTLASILSATQPAHEDGVGPATWTP